MNKKTISLQEYQTKAPSSDDFFPYEDNRQDKDSTLENLFLEKEDRKLRNFLQKKGILTIRELKNGLEISSSSKIGVVQFSNFSVKVLPKFTLNPKNLPKLIGYAFDFDDIIIPESEINFEAEEDQLIDILIAFFVRKCQKLIKQGLLKTYNTHIDDINFLRGKLLLKQQISHQIRHRPVFACEFDELEYNNLENQILLFTLLGSYWLTKSDSLRRDSRIIIRQFSNLVDKKQFTLDAFEKISYNRLNAHYQNLHDLCKLIMSAAGISDFYQVRKNVVSSFFVDMNMVFEKFVSRLFREYYIPEYIVEEQKGKKVWTSDGESPPSIRTDILLSHTSGKKIIIDTKYKRKLSREDPFQIYLYVNEYKQKKGYAILPFYSDSREHTMTSMVSGTAISVKRIDIDNTLDLIYSNNVEDSKKLRDLVITLVPPK